MKPVFVFISTCLLAIAAAGVSALGQQKWTPVPPGGPDSSPDYSWEKSDSGCLRPTDNTYRARLDALGTLLFGTAPSETTGCVTTVYLENKYSNNRPYNIQNHAGLDFRAKIGTPVYSPVSGTVIWQELNPSKETSTLTIETSDRAYNVVFIHCSVHTKAINDPVRKGELICRTGDVGAAAAHLHVEVKPVGKDAPNLKGMSGGRGVCRKSSFTNGWNEATQAYTRLTKPGCSLADVMANTVDPTILTAGASAPSSTDRSQGPASASGTRANQKALVAPLMNQEVNLGCGWDVSAPSIGEGSVFSSDLEDSLILMNIGGIDVRLNLKSSTGTIAKAGDTLRRTFAAPGIVVTAIFEVSEVCPPDDEECEVTQLKAVFDVYKGRAHQRFIGTASRGC